jgi:hypothetical protein
MEFSKKFKLMKKTGIPAEVFHFSIFSRGANSIAPRISVDISLGKASLSAT